MDGDATTPMFTIDLFMLYAYDDVMDTRKLLFYFNSGEKLTVYIPQGEVAIDKLRGKLNKIQSVTDWDAYKQSIKPLR